STEAAVYPFASANELEPGEILLAWPPVENTTLADLKLLQLLLHGLAEEERSLLYKSLVDSKTREFDSGATGVSSTVYLTNSPYFAVPQVWISGIPGKKISPELIDQLRGTVVKTLSALAGYSDQSDSLIAFNKVIADEITSERRSEIVWTKSPPGFGGAASQYAWKDHLERLEMDQGFIRFLSEETVWRSVIQRLQLGKNIWRDLIEKFQLLKVPYATASAPSPQLLETIAKAREDRIHQRTQILMAQYQTADEQVALSRFEEEELIKTREIDRIQARVARPHFTEHPPLTSDDDIRYRELRLIDVPLVASIFDRPPTLDIDLSFDLSRIPARYYKLLPIFPRCLD